jgi:hypothetical protein
MFGVRVVSAVFALAVLTGCATGEAFVDRRDMDLSTKKQKLPGFNGQVDVCYDSDTPREVRDKLAADACEVYGLQATLYLERRWQCRMLTPHLANYYCYDPDMRTADGTLVNPFSKAQVEAWRNEQSGVKAGSPAQ